MRSLRSVVGALRKDHTCESVLVGKIVVGGTRASSVGDGVGAIEIGLALGLKDATEERDVLSRSGNGKTLSVNVNDIVPLLTVHQSDLVYSILLSHH